MATSFYDDGRAAAASNAIDWVADPFEVLLLDASYLFDPTDEAADVPAGSIVASALIPDRVVTPEGWLQASNTTIDLPGSLKTVTSMVIRRDIGDPMLLFSDVPEGIPFRDTGGPWVLRMENFFKAFGRF